MGSFDKTNRQISCTKNIKRKVGLTLCKNKLLWIDETSLTLERSFKAITNLKYELPTDVEMETVPPMELSSLAENIYVKTREVSENTDLDIK